MVESTALEMRRARKGTQGSNPCLSANISMRINEMGLLGPEIPSFRAVLLIATEPQRLPRTPKLVSDWLLSLFTRTSLKKVRSPKVPDLSGFSTRRQPNLLCQILVAACEKRTKGGRNPSCLEV